MSRVEHSGLIHPHAGKQPAARDGAGAADAERVDPADAFELGMSLERRGDFAGAAAAYQRAAERRNITSNLGNLLVSHGEFENAAHVLRRAIERRESGADGTQRRDATIASATLAGFSTGIEDDAATPNGKARRATDAPTRPRRWPAVLVLIAALAAAAATGLATTDNHKRRSHRPTVTGARSAEVSLAPAPPFLLPSAPQSRPKRAAKARHRRAAPKPAPAPAITASVVAPPRKRSLVAAAPRRTSGGGGSGIVYAVGGSSGGGGGSAPAVSGSSGGGGGGSAPAGGGTSSSPPPSSPAPSAPSGTGTASGTDAGKGTGTASGGG